jgi:hypothetical protein
MADQDADSVNELYSVPIEGPASSGVKLNGSLATEGDVSAYRTSPDSDRVVYRADQDTNSLYELYSVPIGGPASSGVKITDPATYGGTSLHVNNFELSPDGNWVLYQASLDETFFWDLYSVPVVGPASSGVVLNPPFEEGSYGLAIGFQISSDSSRVVYHADQDTPLNVELYSVPIRGPASAGVKLNPPLVENGAISWGSFRITPDSSRVIYMADQDTYLVNELYSVPIEGPASACTKLNGALVVDGDVRDYRISPDSNRVLYRADQDTNAVYELYVARIDCLIYLPLVLR